MKEGYTKKDLISNEDTSIGNKVAKIDDEIKLETDDKLKTKIKSFLEKYLKEA